jgi:hypothetical protein
MVLLEINKYVNLFINEIHILNILYCIVLYCIVVGWGT